MPPNYSIIELEKEFSIGSVMAFERVYKIFYSKLHFFVVKITQDEGESEDIVMKSFQKLFSTYKSFDNIKAIQSFLYSCCKNESLDYIRKEKVKQKHINGLTHHINDFGVLEVEYEMSKILLTFIHNQINKLPRKTQSVLKMIYFEEMPIKDIAEKLNLGVDSVRSIKRYGIEKLRQTIKKSDFLNHIDNKKVWLLLVMY